MRFRTAVIGALLFVSGCATFSGPQLAAPAQLAAVAPQPIYGNTGSYMCPYTEDGVVADWVDKAINAKLGAAIGSQAGAYAGRKALENVPFFGGMLGQRVGDAAGRAIAIQASGGWDHIRATSDLSFNSLDDMAVYLYVHHSAHPHFQKVLDATYEIYPDFREAYMPALYRASSRVH
jgi:hypothetical protein